MNPIFIPRVPMLYKYQIVPDCCAIDHCFTVIVCSAGNGDNNGDISAMASPARDISSAGNLGVSAPGARWHI